MKMLRLIISLHQIMLCETEEDGSYCPVQPQGRHRAEEPVDTTELEVWRAAEMGTRRSKVRAWLKQLVS